MVTSVCIVLGCRSPSTAHKFQCSPREAAPKSQLHKTFYSVPIPTTVQQSQDKKLLHDPGEEQMFLPLLAQAALSTSKTLNLAPDSANFSLLSLSATYGGSLSPQSHILSGQRLAFLHSPLPAGTSGHSRTLSVLRANTFSSRVRECPRVSQDALLCGSCSLSRVGSEGEKVRACASPGSWWWHLLVPEPCREGGLGVRGSTCAQQVRTEGSAASSLEWSGMAWQVAGWLSQAAGRRVVAPRGGASRGRGVPSLGTSPAPAPGRADSGPPWLGWQKPLPALRPAPCAAFTSSPRRGAFRGPVCPWTRPRPRPVRRGSARAGASCWAPGGAAWD